MMVVVKKAGICCDREIINTADLSSLGSMHDVRGVIEWEMDWDSCGVDEIGI